MPRLANRQIDNFPTWRMRIQESPQTRPCIVRKVRKPLGKFHLCLNAGIVSPRFPEE